MGGVLGQFGVRAIPFAIVAMVLGTIHPEIFSLSAPLGSKSAGDRVRLASLEPQVGLFDAPAMAAPMPTDTSAAACRDVPFEERFDALEDRPASFDNRFASADDCQSSSNESLASAMEVLANSLRLPPDREVQKKRPDTPPKAPVSKAEVRRAQPRTEAQPGEAGGRTAIYDITARTMHL